jgi:hypothetical protein
MKIVTYSAIAFILLGFATGCAPAKGPRPSVHIPEGLVAVTEKQKALVTWVRGLNAAVSKQQVESVLGAPTDRAKDIWFYHLPESDTHGGYYVTATLSFDHRCCQLPKLRMDMRRESPGPFIKAANKARQPAPVERQAWILAPLARRGCAVC